jgi:hypothetical protein
MEGFDESGWSFLRGDGASRRAGESSGGTIAGF